jgi:LytS/YehU family sensor histidine kinase
MKRMHTKHYIYGGFFLALAVVLPQAFHSIAGAGAIFLPMHIPVFLAGMLVCPMIGLYVGIIAPIISHLLTGMPPISPPILPLMVIELGAYGFVSGFLHKLKKKNVYASLTFSMITGRIALGLAAFTMMKFFGINLNPSAYVKGAVITGLPGIIIQLVLVPVLVILVEKGVAHEGSEDSQGTA